MEMPGTSACTNAFAMNFCPGQIPPPADCELQLYQSRDHGACGLRPEQRRARLIAHMYEVGTDARAQTLLSAMALAAKGDFAQASPGKLNFLDPPILDPNWWRFSCREFVVWNANAIPSGR